MMHVDLGKEHFLIRELVNRILTNAHNFEWSIQGFGMLRLYMENGLRMAIWSKKHRVQNVSMMHTHPWDFRSLVVAGQMVNRRFVETEDTDSFPFMRQAIHAGEGGGLEGDPVRVLLKAEDVDVIEPGEFYTQERYELHVTDARDGTITLCTRKVPVNVSPDHALVYWPEGYEWVSAEPRLATTEEVSSFVDDALIELSGLSL